MERRLLNRNQVGYFFFLSSPSSDLRGSASVSDQIRCLRPSASPRPRIERRQYQKWDKVEDKYAVSTLAFAGAVTLWGTAGMISAIDRLPLVPGALEVVGIGYTGWFAYKNLFFKPDRQAFVAKVKNIYKEIIGSSS